jgi:TatA/E family protein of Tat protein translocase
MTRRTLDTHRSNLARVIGDILQPTHLLLILVVALLVLGPKRLPEVGRMLGKGLRDFRQAITLDDDEREAFAMPPVLDAHHYTATPVQPAPSETAAPATATATMPVATVSAPEAPAPTATAPAPVAEPPTEQTNQAG